MPRQVLQHDVPKIGSVFEREYKGKMCRMSVVEAGMSTGYEVSGKVFKSPTGAAKFVTNNSVNGWIFWGIT